MIKNEKKDNKSIDKETDGSELQKRQYGGKNYYN